MGKNNKISQSSVGHGCALKSSKLLQYDTVSKILVGQLRFNFYGIHTKLKLHRV